MTHGDDAKNISATITKELENLTTKIEELEKENAQLRQKIKELEGSSDDIDAANFGINVDDEIYKPPKQINSSIPAPNDEDRKASELRNNTQEEVQGISSKLGPESIDETNLDDLLANDALSSTVYNRLKPLKSIKYRLLAMQLGISVDRCKEAIDKLVSAGAVGLDDNGVATIKK